MQNLVSYLLASTYSGFSPILNTAAVTCTLNGQNVPCNASLVGSMMAILGGLWIVWFAVMILMIAAVWRIYSKAGRPGWASLVPVYNMVVLLEVVGKPVWWVILSFIPFVNIVVGIIVMYNLAKAFGKGVGYTLGLMFLPFIFYPVLGFGKSVYKGSAVPPLTPTPNPTSNPFPTTTGV